MFRLVLQMTGILILLVLMLIHDSIHQILDYFKKSPHLEHQRTHHHPRHQFTSLVANPKFDLVMDCSSPNF